MSAIKGEVPRGKNTENGPIARAVQDMPPRHKVEV